MCCKKVERRLETAVLLFPQQSNEEQIGHYFMRRSNKFLSNGQLQMALSVALQLEDMTLNTRRLIEIRIEIAVVYTRLGHQSEVLEYYNNALSLVTESHTLEKARIIGNIWSFTPSPLVTSTNPSKLYTQALKLFGDLGLLDKCASIKGNLGPFIFNRMILPKRYPILKLVPIHLANQVNDQGNAGVFTGNKGRCLIQLNQTQQGIDDLTTTIQICDYTNPLPPVLFVEN